MRPRVYEPQQAGRGTAALLKGLSVFPRRFKSGMNIIGNGVGVGDGGVMLRGRSLYQEGEFGEFAAFALNAGSGSSNYWI